VPLHAWHDVGGSKLGTAAAVKAGLELVGLAARVRVQGRRRFFA
jgi:hypothetical protein